MARLPRIAGTIRARIDSILTGFRWMHSVHDLWALRLPVPRWFAGSAQLSWGGLDGAARGRVVPAAVSLQPAAGPGSAWPAPVPGDPAAT